MRSLSGGERNRLLLARLFARPANVLLLDEPTNDLDIDTLELLEDLLQNFDGTVFLVSHDRTFLDNVVTSTLVAEGDGFWREYEGGVQDWLVQSARARDIAAKTISVPSSGRSDKAGATAALATSVALVQDATPKKKLSFKEQRELDALPATLAQLEAEQAKTRQLLQDGKLYTRDPAAASQLHARDVAIDEELLAALERQESLQARVSAS